MKCVTREDRVLQRFLESCTDGVLIGSEALHKSTKRQALRSAGIEVDETVFSRYIGRSDRVMITDVANIPGRSEDGIEAILAEKDRLFALG
jgi:beta-phosphoglucomutase